MAAPVLDYAQRQAMPPLITWPTLVAIVGCCVIALLPCMCGHLDAMAIIATLPTACFSLWGYRRSARAGARAVSLLLVLMAMLLLAKNLLDVGWFGHDAIFR